MDLALLTGASVYNASLIPAAEFGAAQRTLCSASNRPHWDWDDPPTTFPRLPATLHQRVVAAAPPSGRPPDDALHALTADGALPRCPWRPWEFEIATGRCAWRTSACAPRPTRL